MPETVTPELTPAEMRALRAASYGLTIVETASKFFLAPDTIRCQRRRVLAKLGARSTAQAVALAYEAGILGSPRETSNE